MTQASALRWSRAHPEENRARANAWYQAHADLSIERSTAWKRDNPKAVKRHRRTHYKKAHPRPPCAMCGKTIQKRQVFMCRGCAKDAKRARTQEWRARHGVKRRPIQVVSAYVSPKGPYRRRAA